MRLGGWTKPEQEFTALYERLVGRLGKAGLSQAGPETWAKSKGSKDANKPDDMIGKYVGLREWEWRLDGGDGEQGEHVHRHDHGGAGGGNGVKEVNGKRRWTVDHVLVASQEWLVV